MYPGKTYTLHFSNLRVFFILKNLFYFSLDIFLIKDILNTGYWPIYGDMPIKGEFDLTVQAACLVKDDAARPASCPEKSGVAFSYISLMIYMVIGNVLLLNLLIAMFR